ncbi:MAG: hypothetical protein LBV41_06440 [Cytophagaceae bacterium]|jgi:hypothetical protein|nr:hypothetical protein [Cytophagaceae bacterium]
MKKLLFYLFLFGCLAATTTVSAQPVPAVDENITALITFGKEADKAWGDDDFIQIIFFSIPESYQTPVYIRVYDPDVGGAVDELQGVWNTRTTFSIFGGAGACSSKDAQKIERDGNYKSGTMLASRAFAEDKRGQYDGKWFTFGPFDPKAGELLPDYGGYVFKIVVEGTSGDDGNMYSLFLSTDAEQNRAIEGAFAFYFKYKFRLHDNVNEVSHIYPYIDERVIAIKQSNFDWDSDGIIRIISPSKNGEKMAVSGDNNWATSESQIGKDDINSSLDIQMIKDKTKKVKNNNVVIYLENQYGELMPFYSIPIGGIPKYKYSIGIKPKR